MATTDNVIEESDCLWRFVKKDKMAKFVRSDHRGIMENWFVSALVKTVKFPITAISVIIKQTRSGLYFNIYDEKDKIGHASFHYDLGRPGSISHIVDDMDKVRDDVSVRRINHRTLEFKEKSYVDDIYGFFSSVSKGLTDSFNKLIGKEPEIMYDYDSDAESTN